ncbi:TonB-dependent receptor [Pseudoxanthomonas sp. 10H]|uniref:TonB-dependent receptor n=1 Tax=Pseudoxanthomonas sp. 10H TaxID=3242729 RepID=UPI003557E597
MQQRTFGRKTPVTVLATAIAFALAAPVAAQETAAADAPAGQDATTLDKVTVTGYRQSVQKALDEKRYSTEQVDAIFAEDIGKFPDLNLAESMQRIAGVSIDREGGEGQRISIRGLGSDFTRVRLNGLEALSTAGTGTGGVNRSRGFDFNTFASELFSEVKVNKTQSAQMDEGSLGSTVDLRGSRPFDYDGFKAAASAQVGYGELTEEFDPRVSALVSNSWGDGTFGALLSASYSKRTVFEEGYNPVRWEHGNHRNSNQSTAANNGTYGFCSPVGYNPQTPRNPLANETGSAANIARNNGWGTYGISSTACGTGLPRPAATPENIAAYETATNAWIPRYPRYIRTASEIERIGVTGALQWRPSDDTLLSFDAMYSELGKDQREDSLGANLHRAANLGGKTQIVVREAEVDAMNRLTYGVFDNVDFRTEATEIEETTKFQQYSLTLEHAFNDDVRLDAVLGHSSSDYERPVFSLVSFDNSNLDGFVLDMRGNPDMPRMTFPFALNDPSAWSWLGYGNAPVNANGTARGGNISEVRLNPQYVENSFNTAKVDLQFNLNPTFTLRAGLAYKDYDMSSEEYRHISYGRLAQALPAGVGVGDLSTTLDGFGRNLSGAPGSWLAPDFGKVAELLDIYCNCNNGLLGGDYRLASVGHFGASNNNFEVNETSLGTYLQLDFNTELLERAFRGNLGVRVVETQISASGWAPCNATNPAQNSPDCQAFFGVANATSAPGDRFLVGTTVDHSYTDVLPALNMAWDVTEDVVLRFGAAETMARPALLYLSPGVSGGPTQYFDDGRTYSINMGNPQLEPFRSTNYDLSAEWYFQEGGLVSAAVFYKDIDSYIQRTRLITTWEDMGYSLDLLPEGFTPETEFNVQSYYNTPGGPLKGYELTYQQMFKFLPGFWGNFGVQMNYTHVDSEIQYLFSTAGSNNTTVVTTVTENQLLNLSPNSYNATLYYDDGKFSARISTSYRDGYISEILSQENVWDLDGNQLVTADVTGKDSVQNVDFNMSYRFTDHLTATFEAINLTDTADSRYVDSALGLADRYTVNGRQYYVGVRYTF